MAHAYKSSQSPKVDVHCSPSLQFMPLIAQCTMTYQQTDPHASSCPLCMALSVRMMVSTTITAAACTHHPKSRTTVVPTPTAISC